MDNQIEKKKSWFRRHPILTTLGVIIVLIIIVSSGNSTPKKVASTDTAKAEESTDKVYTVGDSVQLGKSIVTVNNVSFSQGGTYSKPSSGNEWINLNVTVENTDSSQQYLTTLGQMFVKDSAGNSYQVSVTDKSFENTNNNLDGAIIAKSKRTGWVGFEIPKGATGLQFVYNGSMWGGGTILVNLGR